MTKQRMVKMTGGDQNILAKALRSAQEEAGPELSGQLQPFLDRVLCMPKHKLYLNDEEYQYATLSLMGCETLIWKKTAAAAGLTASS